MATFTICVLGLELLSVSLTADEPTEEEAAELAGGTTISTATGFTPSYGDQRWEHGAGGGEL